MTPAEGAMERLVEGLRAGNRTVLARVITLLESGRADRCRLGRDVLARILPATGGAYRIGITGVPGVGKSTLIDALGSMLTARGHKVAVLAVDPSSRRTGGSILGDKTRMARLAADPNAFIRPSPTGGTLGGVARMTREAKLLCEAAGYDVIVVETVGVGQSEILVAEMVDIFVALALPGAGDELQGIKKGLIEVADLIAVNKADGDNRLRAEEAARYYAGALQIIEPASPSWRPRVLTLSAAWGDGLEALWAAIREHRAALEGTGELAAKRRGQQVRWLWSLIQDRLLDDFRRHEDVRRHLGAAEEAVLAGRAAPAAAAEELVARFKGARQP